MVGVSGCLWPAPPHWDAVTLIKERDGAPARMAPLYNVTGGSQDGSAGGGNTASLSRGGGGFPRCRASSSFPDFARITMTTGNSGYPGTHSHLEKQKTSFASFAHVGRIRRFSPSGGGGGGCCGGTPSPSVSSVSSPWQDFRGERRVLRACERRPPEAAEHAAGCPG